LENRVGGSARGDFYFCMERRLLRAALGWLVDWEQTIWWAGVAVEDLSDIVLGVPRGTAIVPNPQGRESRPHVYN
jgi:hypothetical protein